MLPMCICREFWHLEDSSPPKFSTPYSFLVQLFLAAAPVRGRPHFGSHESDTVTPLYWAGRKGFGRRLVDPARLHIIMCVRGLREDANGEWYIR